ncbi:MAG: leucine-rich repeat domain-containing protein, partial [Muribaculaceae bacterium]|nr:leucine-rich repeat domain-containing protein [Muribaculaceae bacterium]
SNAFSGTAIRDIEFAANVRTIGESAFSNCRRLVAANIPANVTEVNDGILSSCPRLIATSMNSDVTSVGTNVFANDSKLSNISCAANDAPEAAAGAFDGIRIRYASLTVPTLSFRSYLNAPQWGKFQSIQNRIPVTISQGVDVSNIEETEYQEMLKEDALEAAEDAAAKGELNEPAEASGRRIARRAAQRRATAEGIGFARLFDGAQIMTGNDGSGTRIFINPKEGVTVTSVTYNGKEMLQEMEGNSILLPAKSSGSLVITTDGNVSTAIDTVEENVSNAPTEIYNLNGFKVSDRVEGLAPGIYIVRQGGKVSKISVL